VTLGSAAASSCMPCQADWLNDLSLMPPVSVTMHARKLLPDADAVDVAELDALAELAGLLLALVALDELLPHAATSKVATPAAIVAANEVCLTLSSPGRIFDVQA